MDVPNEEEQVGLFLDCIGKLAAYARALESRNDEGTWHTQASFTMSCGIVVVSDKVKENAKRGDLAASGQAIKLLTTAESGGQMTHFRVLNLAKRPTNCAYI
jgi:hypothetical protein